MSVALHPATTRSTTSEPGRETRHSFSFGPHYDPANLGFGPLVAHNDDRLSPGAGYPDHPHTGLEIVTWVLDGALVHTDSTGGRHVLQAGRAQVLSAGSGIVHSEIADATSGACRFVQAWVLPDAAGGEPSYVVGEGPPPSGELVEVAGGAGLPIGTSGARLLVARLDPGQTIVLPDDPRQHVFAATGSLEVGDSTLRAGDAVRLAGAGGLRVVASQASELVAWSFAFTFA